MGVTSEEIADEFDAFGEQIDDDELLKLQGMCKSWSIDANRIVNEWMAFSASRKVNLSVDTLDVFDREWLLKKLQLSQDKTKTPQDKKGKFYTKENISSAFENDVEILGSYATPEEKSQVTQAAKRQLTPEDLNSSKRRQLGLNNKSPMVNGSYSPVAISPAGATPSAKFSSRSNAGDVVSEFGNTSNVKWTGEGHGCKVTHYDPDTELAAKMKYMFHKMSERGGVLNDVVQEMGTVLQNAHGIEDYAHLALPCQEAVTVCGRVCCDSIGKLNKQSVLLEGSRETSAGKCISLDLTDLKQFSLFPGQVIACDGVNITGKKFSVHKIYDSVPMPFPEVTPDLENVGNQLRVMVAAGPYAPSNSLDYSPLSDLIKYVNRDRPDLVVLMGPFVDLKNTLISTGDVEESFDELFTKQMVEIGRATQDLGCKVVVVSSSRDVHHCSNVYPQPPYSISSHLADGSQRPTSELDVLQHLIFVSDPATLRVNGVVLGLTSTDSLMHLSKSELSVGAPGGSDRMSRLAQHILRQRSYYPLYPPSEDVNVDYGMWEAHAQLPVMPHLLLMPSDLKAFIKDVDGCCFVNPGRLTTGLVGGTYVRMVIDVPTLASSSSPSSSSPPSSACRAQIVKV
ncbi:DNA polymerase alpha subunit B [Aplysia californica]|uniref:DNA polymerase alpha subunit B n=1 Tax=Aplysia californica TaxID=6500 RepID=A0ABM0K9X8_APLCA|nr:DNA polymerase alpha subunit B [Aplysia californica]